MRFRPPGLTEREPPPLILLPGTLCDERLFAPLLERLAARPAAVLIIDQDDPRRAAGQVLARAPGWFALLGFSLGGLVALEVALRAPTRMAGLALIDSNARGRVSGSEEAVLSPDAAVAERWPRYVARARRDDRGLRAVIDAMAAGVGAERFAAQERLARARDDKRDRLAALTMPALVLAGAEDAICPPPLQHEMAERLPDVTLALIEGVGHFAPLEAPDAVAAHVAAWLRRVDRAANALSML